MTSPSSPSAVGDGPPSRLRLSVAGRAWCERCQELWSASELGEGGACPRCAEPIITTRSRGWQFRLFLGGSAVYLLWRLGQGLDWLARYVGRHH